jgi:hypothetical protein
MGKKNSKPVAKRKGAAKPLPGIPLEKAVARVQEMLDPNSKVSHNEVLEDRMGNMRQFDVVIRGTFGGHPILGVVECKDHNRKKNTDAVEAFAKKSENLGAHLKIRVNLDLWYSGPPAKGGHRDGSFTLRRSTDAPDRGA